MCAKSLFHFFTDCGSQHVDQPVCSAGLDRVFRNRNHRANIQPGRFQARVGCSFTLPVYPNHGFEEVKVADFPTLGA